MLTAESFMFNLKEQFISLKLIGTNTIGMSYLSMTQFNL